MENLLKQIVSNTEPKEIVSIVVSDNKTRFEIWLKPPIPLDKKKDYEIALINLETYYSFPNIGRSNNCFLLIHLMLTHHGLTLLFLIVVITLKISTTLFNEKWEKNDYYDKASDKNNIEISANTNTLKSEMFLKNNYEVDFRRDKSINSLLGFHSNLNTSGFHESENMVNILTIIQAYSSILILFQVVMSMVPHNSQFTRSFQMSPPGIKLSKILIIFFTFQ